MHQQRAVSSQGLQRAQAVWALYHCCEAQGLGLGPKLRLACQYSFPWSRSLGLLLELVSRIQSLHARPKLMPARLGPAHARAPAGLERRPTLRSPHSYLV